MAAAAVAVAVAPRARVARVSRRDARVPRAAATPRAARAVVRRRALAAEARARNVGTVGGDPRKRASSSVARAEAAGDAIPATPATPAVASRSSAVATSSESKRIVLLCAIAMLLASADRTIFSLGSLAIAADLSLNMHALGLLQSSFLWGYGFTQILGGVAADEFGGARVLLVGLGLWSIAVAAIPFCASTSAPVAAMVAARVVFGAASGCALPGSAAAVASYVTPERRAGALSVIFTLFNCGSAFGLLLAGGLISTLGWQSVFAVFGGVGVAWSAFGIAALPEVARRGKRKEKPELSDGAAEVSSGENAAANDAVAGWGNLPGWMYAQLFAIGWCHVCVNWGFFILQSWLPVYLAKDLGFSLGGSGLASALPWFLTAFTCGATGVASDALLKNGAERWKVRRLMMNIATIGPCVALLLLPLAKSATIAVALLGVMLGSQAVAIGGYLAYMQDVAPARAGAFLGVTNTVGVAAGIAANVLTGFLVERTGGFDAVFLVTAGVYASSAMVWNAFLKGRMLFPGDADAVGDDVGGGGGGAVADAASGRR